METVILMLYLATWNAAGGMTVATQEFATADACQEAAKVAIQRFGGIYTRVFWTCVGRVSGAEKSNGRN